MLWYDSLPLVSQTSSFIGRSSIMTVWEMNSGAVVGGRTVLKFESMNLLRMLDFPTPC